MKITYNHFYTLIFCAIVFTPPLVLMANSVLLDQSDSAKELQNENRTIAPWPSKDVYEQGIDHYASQINKYLEDRLLFRSAALSSVTKARLSILAMESNNEAIIGKDGWLFLKRNVSSAVGLSEYTLSDEEIQRWANNALAMKQKVEANQGQFIIVIPPDKAQVYPEYMGEQLKYSRSARFLNRLKPALEKRGIVVVDLLEEMLAARARYPDRLMYSKTDTHWTSIGALLAYQAVIAKLNSMGLNLKAVSEEDLNVRMLENFSGDIAKMLGLRDTYTEPLEFITAKKHFSSYAPTKRMLMLGDSFYERSMLLWQYSFNVAKCVHHNVGQPNIDIIDKADADVVIFLMVERNLSEPLSLSNQAYRKCA